MSKSPRQGVLHNEELFLVNRIITYFEENNEINLKNYHTSQVREFSNPNISRFNDYFVELPTSTAVTAVGQHGQYIDENIVALQQMFRRELIGRKIAINDLPEELHFVEFWMTQGENFEWVEPDQDPAEIVRFRKNS
ncbi:hypothetical protein PSN45_004252 [Yamadazyma tenuis]|nr:hypothetical protein PSN45_004252 [Yamadazyma tenuis]